MQRLRFYFWYPQHNPPREEGNEVTWGSILDCDRTLALMRRFVLHSVNCHAGRVAGSNPGRNNTQGLKLTEEKVLPLSFHLQMVRLSSLLG